jgi:hypothetical protein
MITLGDSGISKWLGSERSITIFPKSAKVVEKNKSNDSESSRGASLGSLSLSLRLCLPLLMVWLAGHPRRLDRCMRIRPPGKSSCRKCPPVDACLLAALMLESGSAMPAENATVPVIMERIARLSRAYGLDEPCPFVHQETTGFTIQARESCNSSEPSHAEATKQGAPHELADVDARISVDSGCLVLQQASHWAPSKKRLQRLAVVALLLALP